MTCASILEALDQDYVELIYMQSQIRHIIGVDGKTVNRLKQDTNTRIHASGEALTGDVDPEKVLKVEGAPQEIRLALESIIDILVNAKATLPARKNVQPVPTTSCLTQYFNFWTNLLQQEAVAQ